MKPSEYRVLNRPCITLTVIIPCYNEEKTVEMVVESVRAIDVATEIICVNDASSDRTADVLNALLAQNKIQRCIHQQRNLGKGAAVRAGIREATGHIVAIQDADLEYNPKELPVLMEPILEGNADAVFGSRFKGAGPGRVLFFWHRLANAILTVFSNMLTDINLTDMETGYKLIRSDLIKLLPLKSDRFGFEPEITACLARAGARIYEIGISYHGRTYAEGKKIGWRDGIAALWHILCANRSARSVDRIANALPPFSKFVEQNALSDAALRYY